MFVLLGMGDAGPAGCELHVASAETGEVVVVVIVIVIVLAARLSFSRATMHRVPMRKFPGEDIRKDLRVTMLMRREPRPRRNAVFIQHAQGTKGLEARVGVLRKGEGVVAI